MGKIVLLDELTINQIAAGEVIERPASVVKEMVENSIDAGATNITVEIKNGGISFIKITDNGKGIAQDDLEIAFERHATSKIRSAEDLNTITSMGFRGEALASIAAISNVELISKTEEQETGYKIVVEAGNVLEKEIAGASVGTTITVKKLFFNTPVRYKFLKKDYTESGYIEDVITRIALVHPEIAIKLINTGKTVIQTNGNGDLKSVIYSIYGKNVAENCMPVSYTYEDLEINGVVGKPEIARSNRANQLFFVNQRYIKDKTLSSASEQAYKGMIPLGKFGFVILNINMNPAKVDVNVHPTKLEVRFQEESKIFQAIFHAIKDTILKNGENQGLFGLRKADEQEIKQYTETESQIKTNMQEEPQEKIEETRQEHTEQEKLEEAPSENIEQTQVIKVIPEENQEQNLEQTQVISTIPEENQEQNLEQTQVINIMPEENKEQNSEETQVINTILGESQEQNLEETQVINLGPKKEQEKKKPEPSIFDKLIQLKNIPNRLYDVTTKNEEKTEQLEEQPIEESKKENEDFHEMYEKLFGKTTKPQEQENKNEEIDIINDNVSVFDDIEEYKKQPYKVIGIAFNTYIIIEMNKEIYIIDQHAAHERILYEKVKKNYYESTNKDSQMLLLPDVITLTHKEMDIAKENFEMFKQAGFELEEFGENTIKLTGVPTICIDLNTKELFLETLDEINTIARTAKQEKEEKFIATVACKAAVKANMALTTEEIQNLMDKLLELPNPFSCPHGRPTAIRMSQYDIERKFARK